MNRLVLLSLFILTIIGLTPLHSANAGGAPTSNLSYVIPNVDGSVSQVTIPGGLFTLQQLSYLPQPVYPRYNTTPSPQLALGYIAPPISLFDARSGDPVEVSKYTGKGPVILHFWGTRIPSEKRLQELDDMQTQHANDGLKIVGIAIASRPYEVDRVRRTVTSLQLSFPVLIDPQGNITTQEYKMERSRQGVVLLDRDGKILAAVRIRDSRNEEQVFAQLHAAAQELVDEYRASEGNGSRELGTGDALIQILAIQPDRKTPAANVEVRLGKPDSAPIAKTDSYGRVVLEKVEMDPSAGRLVVRTKQGLYAADGRKTVPIYFIKANTEVARGELKISSDKRVMLVAVLRSGFENTP